MEAEQGVLVQTSGEQRHQDPGEPFLLDEPRARVSQRLQEQVVLAIEDTRTSSRPNHRNDRLGSSSSTVGCSVTAIPPGGSSRTSSRAPTRGCPVMRGMNGFQVGKAAKSVRMSTRAQLARRCRSRSASVSRGRFLSGGLKRLNADAPGGIDVCISGQTPSSSSRTSPCASPHRARVCADRHP